MSQKSKKDWFEAGLDTLGEAGSDGLTIQALSERLGVTKGSFYHHFGNMKRFEHELITHWAEQYLATAGELPEKFHDRLALLDAIMNEAFSRMTKPEMAIRAWAMQDPDVRAVVEKVEHVRKEFIRGVFSGAPKHGSHVPLMTELLSSLLIGCFTSFPPLSRERVLQLYEEFKRLYGLN